MAMTQAAKYSVCIECSCTVIKFNTHPTHSKRKEKPLIRRAVDDKTKRPNFIVLNIKSFVFLHLPAHLNSTLTFMFPSNPLSVWLNLHIIISVHIITNHVHSLLQDVLVNSEPCISVYNEEFFVRFNQTESG